MKNNRPNKYLFNFWFSIQVRFVNDGYLIEFPGKFQND